jgi:hypothetical protein
VIVVDENAPSNDQGNEQIAGPGGAGAGGADVGGTPAADGPDRPWYGRRAWQLIVGAIVLVALAAAIGFVAGRGSGSDQQVSTATTEATAESTTPATADSTVPETGYTAPPQTAARDLDGFLTLARAADQSLTEAAARINASTTATDITYDDRTVGLLTFAAPSSLARSLPPGMPDQLQQAALLVYSDLVSRWAAMSAGPCPHDAGTHPRSQYDENHCFVEGAAAAARTDGDIAALDHLAGSTPKFTIPAQDSRPAEELAARANSIDLQNLGCANVGGVVVTELIPIVWQTQPSGDDRGDWQGTVGEIPFRGTYDQARGWVIEIRAC